MGNTLEELEQLYKELKSIIRDYNTITIGDVSEFFYRVKDEVLEVRKEDYDRFKVLVNKINKFTPNDSIAYKEVDCYEKDDRYVCISFINK